jgi:hypothetical protein
MRVVARCEKHALPGMDVHREGGVANGWLAIDGCDLAVLRMEIQMGAIHRRGHHQHYARRMSKVIPRVVACGTETNGV